MSLAVGVDVGATKVAAARIDVARGAILAARRIATAPQRGPQAVLAYCRALAAELGDGAAASGIAVCELVDPSGRVCSAETIDWRDVDLLAVPPATPQGPATPLRGSTGRVRRAGRGAGRGALRRRRDEPDFPT